MIVQSQIPLVKFILKNDIHSITDSYQYEDLLSIGTIGLIKAINNYDPNENVQFGTYTYRIIKNDMLGHINKENKNAQMMSLDSDDRSQHKKNDDVFSLYDVLQSDSILPDKAIKKYETFHNIYNALKLLKPVRQKIIMLYYGLEGEEVLNKQNISSNCYGTCGKNYPLNKIAEMLNMPESTVRTEKLRAEHQIKNYMKFENSNKYYLSLLNTKFNRKYPCLANFSPEEQLCLIKKAVNMIDGMPKFKSIIIRHWGLCELNDEDKTNLLKPLSIAEIAQEDNASTSVYENLYANNSSRIMNKYLKQILKNKNKTDFSNNEEMQ